MTFSFGRNWKAFSKFVSEATLAEAQEDIVGWLGRDAIAGKSVVDVGSGSGIHSLCFHRLGAAPLLSIDVDSMSVATTRHFWERTGRPSNWEVRELSILDDNALRSAGTFDVVYSWGVLHHTGQMWKAIENAAALAPSPGALLWISLYASGPNYAADLRSKQDFNRMSWLAQRAFVWRFLYRRWRNERRKGRGVRDWYWHGRGMNAYHDAVDWFGGLPYEVASVEEVTAFLGERGWAPERIEPSVEGGCTNFLFRRATAAAKG